MWKLKSYVKFGAKSNHLKLSGNAGGKRIEAVGFQIGDVVDRLSTGSKIDLAGEVQINEWNGNRKLQVLLKDVRCKEWQLFDFRGKKFNLPSSVSPWSWRLSIFNLKTTKRKFFSFTLKTRLICTT